MTEFHTIWIARGPCHTCSRPTARRVEGPGVYGVGCQACGGTSQIASVEVRLNRPPAPMSTPAPPRTAGPAPAPPAPAQPPAAPVAPPVVTPAVVPVPDAPLGPKTRRPLRAGLQIAALIAATLLVAAVVGGSWAYSQSEAKDEFWNSPWANTVAAFRAERLDWTTLQVQVVPEFTEAKVVFTARVQAYDAEGNALPVDRLREAGEFYFAWTPTLLDDLLEVKEWKSCDPRKCRFEVPNGSAAYIHHGAPGGPGAVAVDLKTMTLYSYRPEGFVPGTSDFAYVWQPHADWSYLNTFGAIRPVMVEVYGIHVKIEGPVEGTLDFEISFLQKGKVVDTARVQVEGGPYGFSFPTWGYLPRSGGPVTIRVDDPPNGAQPVSITVKPGECEGFGMRVTLHVSDSAPLRFGATECLSPDE